jgi:hypothetical protein
MPVFVFCSLAALILGGQILFLYVRKTRHLQAIAALPSRMQQLSSAQGELTKSLLHIAGKGLLNARQITLAGETIQAARILKAAERCVTLAEVLEGNRPPVRGKDGHLLENIRIGSGVLARVSFLQAFETAILGFEVDPPWANELDDTLRLVDLEAATAGKASVFGTPQYKLMRKLRELTTAAPPTCGEKVLRYIDDLAARCDGAIRASAYVSKSYQARKHEVKAEEQLKLIALLADPNKHHRLPTVIAIDLAA